MLVGWFAKMSWCYSCVQQGYKIKKKKMYCRSWEFLFLPSGSFLVLTLVNLKNTLPASVFHSRAAVGATSTQREEASLASLADKPSTPFHIYCSRARLMSPANLARPLIQFQAGTGDPRINLVNSLLRPAAFIFLIFFFFHSKGSRASLECVPAPVDKTPYFTGHWLQTVRRCVQLHQYSLS